MDLHMATPTEHLLVTRKRRIRARDAKLLAREEALASAWDDLKRACPCKVCIVGILDNLIRPNILKHIKLYAHHPFHRGSIKATASLYYQSFCDPLILRSCFTRSNVCMNLKWCISLSWYTRNHSWWFRLWVAQTHTPQLWFKLEKHSPGRWGELDVGLDMVDMVHHACHHSDREVHFDERFFAKKGAPASRPPAQDHHPEAMPPYPMTNVPLQNKSGEQACSEDHRDSLGGTEWGDTSEELEDVTSHDGTCKTNGLDEQLLEEAARLRLFLGSPLSSLWATLLLLVWCRSYRCSLTFIDELFKLLSKSILPLANTFLTSKYLGSKKLRELGFSFKSIHACQNSCMLLRG